MQLVVATYERFLLGFRLPQQLEEGPDCKLQRSFTHAAHQGPVRCLDAAGPWLVSGGQDDQLHIYDTKAGRDLGFVMNPGDGPVTCLAFFTPPGAARPTHLLSGSDDGSIAIWRAGGDWEALKLMRGHKGPVRALALHPSGRLALSVGHDRLIKLWCLARGRCSYSARLEEEADAAAFSADGESYALVAGKLISLHSAASGGGVAARLTHARRVTAMLSPPPSAPAAAAAGGGGDADADAAPQGGPAAVLLLSGCDDGRLCLWDVAVPQGGPVWELPAAHAARIRAITPVTPAATAGGLPSCIATASSDGVVALWDSSALGGPAPALKLLCRVATSGRITGMVLAAPERAPAAAAAAAAAAAVPGGQGASEQQQQQQRKSKGAKRKEKRKQREQREQQQQQHEQAPAVPAPAPAKQAGQRQKHHAKGEQQQQQHKKRKQQQQQQQQQRAAKGGRADQDSDGGGFEVVPAPDGGSSQQQQQQQRRPPGAGTGAPKPRPAQQQAPAGGDAPAKQQRARKHKHKHKQQAAGGVGAGGAGEAALVPRVQTVIRKKSGARAVAVHGGKHRQGHTHRKGGPGPRRNS